MERLLTVALLLALFASVSAVSAIQVSPTSFTIPSNVPSSFNISFYNNGNTTANITLNTAYAKIIYGYFFSNIAANPQTFALAPFSSKIIKFSFNPSGSVSSLPIAMNISYSDNGHLGYFILSVSIVPTQNIIYSVSHSASIYPYKPLDFNVSMVNVPGQIGAILPIHYGLYYGGSSVAKISSTATLSALGINIIPLSLVLNSSLAPGNYTLYVSTTYAGQSSSFNTTVAILPYYSMQETTESSIGIFGGTKSETFTNDGNEKISTENTSMSVGGLDSLFLTSKSASIGSPVMASSALSTSASYLLPGQSLTLSYSVSYIPLYLIIAVIIFAVAVFLYLNRKVVISKEVVEHKVVGGFVDVKIALKIRNVSRKAVTSLSVVDAVPPNALKISSVGPKEGRITKSAGSMAIKWSEGDLQPNDEIMLVYEMKSKLGIVGSINLGKAEVSFTSEDKRYRRRSNSLVLNIK